MSSEAQQVERAIFLATARALFVIAYARQQEALEALRKKHVRPLPGGDWADVAPKTPHTAFNAAARLIAFLESRNNESLVFLWLRFAKQEGLDPDDREEQSKLGHLIARQSFGLRSEGRPLPFEVPPTDYHER